MNDCFTLLADGLSAMAIDLPEDAQHKLIEFVDLIVHWNKSYNLTAVREPEAMVSKHLLDSLALLPLIGTGSVLDIGSGAGLPGIPLALALPANPFVLLDKNGKKTRFLTQARIELGLDNIEVINSRIEDYLPGIYFDHIVARAFADSGEVLASSRHLHRTGTRILVMQGKLDEHIDVDDYVLKQSHRLEIPGLDADRHVLEIVKQ